MMCVWLFHIWNKIELVATSLSLSRSIFHLFSFQLLLRLPQWSHNSILNHRIFMRKNKYTKHKSIALSYVCINEFKGAYPFLLLYIKFLWGCFNTRWYSSVEYAMTLPKGFAVSKKFFLFSLPILIWILNILRIKTWNVLDDTIKKLWDRIHSAKLFNINNLKTIERQFF